VKLITTYAFENTDAKRLFAKVVAPDIAPDIASQKILEKCGYIPEGIHKCSVFRELENSFMDEYQYAQTRL